MSTLHISVGQAGAQVGSCVQRYSGRTTPGAKSAKTPPSSGCVFVDSEPKVVLSVCSAGNELFVSHASRTAGVVFDENGRGNSWAWGYSSRPTHAPTPTVSGPGRPAPSGRSATPLPVRALDAIRRQVEALDACSGILFTHSLGGGTGSGLGSRLLELVRDEYPSHTLVSACVAPFLGGDTPLQYYNVVLSLATAHECADAIFLFDNDDLLRRAQLLQKWQVSHAERAGVSLPLSAATTAPSAIERGVLQTRDLNAEIARSLGPVIAPLFRGRTSPGFLTRGDGDDGGGQYNSGALDRPVWYDLRQDLQPPAFSDGAFAPTSDEGDGRDVGAVEASSASSDGAALPPGAYFDVDAEAYCVPESALRSGSLPSLVRALVPSPAFKYVDARGCDASSLKQRSSAMRGETDIFADTSPWIELADHVAELLPRPGAAPVTAPGVSAGGAARRKGHSTAPAPSLLAAHVCVRGFDEVDAAMRDRGAPHARSSSAARLGGSNCSGSGGSISSSSSYRTHGSKSMAVASSSEVSSTVRGLPGGEGGFECGPSTAAQWATVSQRLARGVGGGLPLARWTSEVSAPWTCPERPSQLGSMKSLALYSNGPWMRPLLSHCAVRAAALLDVGAYVHWYERFGISAEHIRMAVDSTADVVAAYGAL